MFHLKLNFLEPIASKHTLLFKAWRQNNIVMVQKEVAYTH